jgi:hypothetical protein
LRAEDEGKGSLERSSRNRGRVAKFVRSGSVRVVRKEECQMVKEGTAERL